MFRRIFAALAVVVGLSAPALAQTVLLHEDGPWEVYGAQSSSGNLMCYAANIGDTMGLVFKFEAGDNRLFVSAISSEWKFATGHITLMRVSVDGVTGDWSGKAVGEYSSEDGIGSMQMFVPFHSLEEFETEVRQSNTITISFPDMGYQWSGGLSGINSSFDVLAECIGYINE